ncbi:hypothetical protein PV350_35360 [Streptomyces sp. PA03-6a]|nr:hypothetical protein [Streptomyces sp. PA03-6a]
MGRLTRARRLLRPGIPEGVTMWTRFELPVELEDANDGTVIGCPECGETFPLVLGIDSGDASDAPSYLTCPAGHTWAEPRCPRRLGGAILDALFRDNPGRFMIQMLHDERTGYDPRTASEPRS